jgi:hypothetical protein
VSTDHLLDRLREWRRFNYGPELPQAVVLGERDWMSYVLAMAEAVPAGEQIHFPSEEDVLWSWPDGVLVVFDQPVPVAHTIISQTIRNLDPWATDPHRIEAVPPHSEQQLCAALVVCAPRMVQTNAPDGTPLGRMLAYPCIWIGEDPSDVISGHWMPGMSMHATSSGPISFSSRLQLSIITALGHRLTRLGDPTGTRGERRRVERELPALRVLALASGASVSSRGGSVEWSRRWMVRGHWRLQPYGPERALRRPVWIDPYVKGPEDKPLDVRPTIWRANV